MTAAAVEYLFAEGFRPSNGVDDWLRVPQSSTRKLKQNLLQKSQQTAQPMQDVENRF